MVTYDGHAEGPDRRRSKTEHPIQNMTIGIGGVTLLAALGFLGAKETGVLTRFTTQPAAAADTVRRTSSALLTSGPLVAQAPAPQRVQERRAETSSLPSDYISADSGFPRQAAINRELRLGKIWGRDLRPEDVGHVTLAIGTGRNSITAMRDDGGQSIYLREE